MVILVARRLDDFRELFSETADSMNRSGTVVSQDFSKFFKNGFHGLFIA